MKITEINNANKYLDKLLNGDYGESFDVVGFGKYRDFLIALEKLRVKLAFEQNNNILAQQQVSKNTAGIIHDLKTPLAIIMGYAECLRDNIDDTDYASLIIDKVMQLNNQVLKLLEVQKTEKKPQKMVVDCHSFLLEEFLKYKKLAESKNITYKVDKHISKSELYINKEEISRVIQNVISNAINYNKSKGTIKIKTYRYRYFMCISIKDTGIGINKEDLPFIFDMYYKGDKSRTNTSSSGVGLYVVKQIIDSYGGQIKVFSKPQKGTTFYIFLPILEPNIRKYTSKMMDAFPYFTKLSMFFFFGFISSPLYRFLKFEETYNFKYLFSGLLLIPFFLIGWIADFLSILLTNQITFLSNFTE